MRGAISAHQGSSLVIAGARACSEKVACPRRRVSSEKVACPGRRVSSPSLSIRATHRQSVVIMANQRSSTRLLGKVAVADLASSRRAVAPHLAHRKGREDVLQVEALPLLAIEVLVPDEEGHWASSGVIGRHQRSSEVIRRHQWQSAYRDTIESHQRSSDAISGNQWQSAYRDTIESSPRSSDAISGNKWQSAYRDTIESSPRTVVASDCVSPRVNRTEP